MNKQGNPKHYALADIVMRMVQKGDRGLKLHPRASLGFKMALDAMFANTTLDARQELEAVVRLGALFQRDRLPELAGQINDLLAHDPRALAVLGISSGKATRDAKQRFAKLVTGKKDNVIAPIFGKAAPAGSMKVSSFLEPGADLKRRATASKRPVRLAR
jgi:hypothetical protein